MYQKITLHGQPYIRFAHSYATTRYDLFFPAMPQRLELTCQQEGDAERHYADGHREDVPEGSVVLTTYERPIHAVSEAFRFRHITVGFDVPSYTVTYLTREELLAEIYEPTPEAASAFYLPETGMISREGSPVEGILQRLVGRYALPEAGSLLRCHSPLWELLAALTEETVRMAALESGTLSPATVRYAQRAVRYIAAHLSDKLTVAQIAEELHITPGYLSTLFRGYTGVGVIRYINAARIERVKALLFRPMTLREAGENVGWEDTNYVSRLFKAYTGQSVRDFLRESRSIGLTSTDKDSTMEQRPYTQREEEG